jgi:hypothetical protein
MYNGHPFICDEMQSIFAPQPLRIGQDRIKMEHKSLASDRSLIDVNFDGYKLSATTLENASLDIDRYWYHCLSVLAFHVFY